jgi:hypothetical protein
MRLVHLFLALAELTALGSGCGDHKNHKQFTAEELEELNRKWGTDVCILSHFTASSMASLVPTLARVD